MSNRNEVYGWHILPFNKKLRYGDDRKVRLNEPLSVKGTLEMCSNGLHASRTPFEASHWWRQTGQARSMCWLTICRLSRQRLTNMYQEDEPQKWCARTRTTIGMTLIQDPRMDLFLKKASTLARRDGAVLRKDLSILEVKAKRPRRKKAPWRARPRKRSTESSASPR